MTILDQLAEYAGYRVAADKEKRQEEKSIQDMERTER